MISVVIPLYNKSATVIRAIDSVLNQTERCSEIIVVNDGSTDNSEEVVRERYGGLVIVVTQINSGPGAARNKGLSLSRTDLVAFLDADDTWEPDFLRRAISVMRETPEVGAYVCRYIVTTSDKFLPKKASYNTLPVGRIDVSLIDSNTDIINIIHSMHSSSMVMRRSIVKSCGGYYEKNKCLFGEDSYLMISIAFKSDIFLDDRYNTKFFIDDSSLGHAIFYRHEPTPISMHGRELLRHCPPEKSEKMWQVICRWAAHDVKRLVISGEFSRAVELRRSYELPKVGFMSDKVYYLLHHSKRLLKTFKTHYLRAGTRAFSGQSAS